MGYIGTQPQSQHFQEGQEGFVPINNQVHFSLRRPIPSIHSIQVLVDSNVLPPSPLFYTVNHNVLSVTQGVNAGSYLQIRYLTVPALSEVAADLSIPVSHLVTTGIPNDSNFLRGDAHWNTVGIPQNYQTADYTVTRADVGCHIFAANNSNITVPQDVFYVGDIFSVWAPSSGNLLAGGSTIFRNYIQSSPIVSAQIVVGGKAFALCVGYNEWVIGGQLSTLMGQNGFGYSPLTGMITTPSLA